MGKRVTILFVVILISAVVVMGYFLQQGRKSLFTDPYKTISAEACIVIETIDFQSFMNNLTTGKGLFGEAGNIKELDAFNQKLKYITDQLNNTEFNKLLNDGTAIISFYPNDDGKIFPLLSLTVPGEIRFRQIKDICHSSGIKTMVEGTIKGSSLLKIPYNVSNLTDTVYLSLRSGLLVCSSSRLIIEKAIDQMDMEGDVRDLPGFSRVLLASGKNEDKIFVIFANLIKPFKKLLGSDGARLAEKFSKVAGTAGGDIYINEDGVVLSGYTESTDSSEYLYKYKFIPPRAFQTYKVLPSSTVLFETVVLPDKDSGNRGTANTGRNVIDLADKLKEFTGDEITKALIDIRERPVGDNSLIIYELSNRGRAEQIFLEDLGTDKEVLYFEPDDQVRIPVYKTSYKGLTDALMPGFAPGFEDIYFSFYDNFMLSSNSFVTISRFLYENLLNKTLVNDITYRDFESTLPSRAGYFFYCVPSRILDYLSGFLDKDLLKAFLLNKRSINKIQAVGYQFASSNEMIYNSLSVKFRNEEREESTTEWETLLDTTACIKPFFFTNHNTGAKEIFIQDLKNNTYLINAAGRVLWKVPLRERISGTIYMIDYYKNGKYQLLFAGRDFIHILDRNGNYVERYPVKLRSPASNSLALFDYDNNLNYRLFIAGEDKLIYSYDKTGNVVKGWKPFRTSGLVKAEINYFKVSGKDYIVASDATSIYFLDRTGNKRLNLKEAVSRSVGSTMTLIQGSEPSVVCSSSDGTVQHIYFDGSIKKFSLKKFSADHSFDIFDEDGDGFGEYIFIDKGILYLYDHNRSEMFTREFGSSELGGPINFIFSSSDRKIGVFDINKNLIYLINKNGETMNGFPLRGASMFSIGKLSDRSGWHLIVGGTNRFLYNYRIETETK